MTEQKTQSTRLTYTQLDQSIKDDLENASGWTFLYVGCVFFGLGFWAAKIWA